MIQLIISLTAMFIWLLKETDWLRVNLMPPKLKFARYEVYQMLRPHKTYYGERPIHEGGTTEKNKLNGNPIYQIIVSPGITNILCGFEWLDQHCADLVGYEPIIQMNLANVRYTMHIKALGILPEVMKANKLTKAQKFALAFS